MSALDIDNSNTKKERKDTEGRDEKEKNLSSGELKVKKRRRFFLLLSLLFF